VFFTILIIACHWALCWLSLIKFTPPYILLHISLPNITLPSTPRVWQFSLLFRFYQRRFHHISGPFHARCTRTRKRNPFALAVKIKTGVDLLIKCCVTSRQTADIWNSEVGQNILAPPWGLHALRSLATRLETWTVRHFLSNSKFLVAHINRLGI
jgi:hypothetical protein